MKLEIENQIAIMKALLVIIEKLGMNTKDLPSQTLESQIEISLETIDRHY